ncbi:hypothetical protein DB346_03005 [Verrucomicrobia bacterium LW23]|nr:hypothetical protein DB346_03650 [Verrucomicrobia bacterium LW23]PTY04418.1 hypothetical protein DB346_03005 [Verrucomicrobia bacterium LW23]
MSNPPPAPVPVKPAAPANPADPILAAVVQQSAERNQLNNPTRVVNAFYPEVVTVEGIKLHPVSLHTFMLLEQVGNALVDQQAQAEERKVTFRDLLEAFYALTISADELEQVVGDGTFRAKALAFSRTVTPKKAVEIGEAVKKVFILGWSTVPGPGAQGAPGKEQAAPATAPN